MNNEELSTQMSAMRSGDKNAFEKIYEDLKTPVYTIIVRMIGDTQLAEDLLQEVFLKLYRSPAAGEIRNPRAYLFQMAHHLAIDSIRSRKADASLDEMEDTVPMPEQDVALRLDVENAMQLLPSLERQIVTLHVNAGLTFGEVAKIVEKPLGTVLWRYQSAVSKLRKYLSGGAI